MPECHACKRKPGPHCWTVCNLSETPKNHGKTHVSVDEVKSFVPAPVPPEETYHDLDAAVHFVRCLCGLRLIEREILFARLLGQEYPEITRRLNRELGLSITVQAVHYRAKTALKDPAFRELFRGMVARQNRRSNGKRAVDHKAPIESDRQCANLYKLPRLLAQKAELEAALQDCRFGDDWRPVAQSRLADINRRILCAWKFPHQVNPGI